MKASNTFGQFGCRMPRPSTWPLGRVPAATNAAAAIASIQSGSRDAAFESVYCPNRGGLGASTRPFRPGAGSVATSRACGSAGCRSCGQITAAGCVADRFPKLLTGRDRRQQGARGHPPGRRRSAQGIRSCSSERSRCGRGRRAPWCGTSALAGARQRRHRL